MTTPTTQSRPVDGRDRERQRAERGLRSTASFAASVRGGGVKPPRRRRPLLALLAVLLIVGGAAVAGLLAVRLDARTDVLVVDQDVATGELITAEMLARTPVASEGLMLVPADQADAVIGTYARAAIRQGQLLDTSMVTNVDPIGDDRAAVGVPLAGGRVPAGLRAGDLVRVVRLGDANTAVRPLTTALVMETAASTDGGALVGEGATSSTATLLVPTGAADAVVDAAGNDVLGMSLVERGVPVDEASLTTLGR